MSLNPHYVVITPVRNEELNIQKTIESFVNQKILPSLWIVVDDGSKDKTGDIIDEAAAKYPWITAIHRADRGFRQPGTGVVEAFYDGYPIIGATSWDFLVKFDGDLQFQPDYFESCFARFAQDPQLGIGGGVECYETPAGWVGESLGDPLFHVRGATKIYRRACWEQIGGLHKAPGWDTLDELKANMLGWKTCTFRDHKILQLKRTGSADGRWRNWVKNGLANYITGYHPVFMFAKCGRRLWRRPYITGSAGLTWGYIKGWLTRVPRVPDKALIKYIQDQQLRRLTGRKSIW